MPTGDMSLQETLGVVQIIQLFNTFKTIQMGTSVLEQSRILFYQILVTFLISHLTSNFKTFKTKNFRVAEDGLWWPPAGLGKGLLDWLGKVRLG